MILGISGKKGSGKTTLAHAIMDDPTCWPVVLDAFAKPIKDICTDILGLDPMLVHGTDEDKNTITPYPPSATNLTVRQIMQMIGTEWFRSLDPDVWAKALVRRADPKALVVVHDVRFPNEVEAIQKAGGRVVRLLRSLDATDTHVSETALDHFDGFDMIIDNRGDCTPHQTFLMLRDMLKQWRVR